jgi:hypothetical protein
MLKNLTDLQEISRIQGEIAFIEKLMSGEFNETMMQESHRED